MNKKAIKSVIRKKINEWLESIEDLDVRKLARENTIVTGGCITSMLLSEEVKDFDIYFKNKETTEKLANYYVSQFKLTHPDMGITVQVDKEDRVKILIPSQGVASDKNEVPTDESFEDVFDVKKEVPERKKYRPVYLSSNAITLSDKIQLVIRFYGEPEVIHKNYDFIHATNYWTSNNDNLVLHQAALESILTKELVYVGSKYPLCSVIRTRKFIQRGWKINAGQYLKMCFQLSELNLKDIKVLEDQLVGVDSAYFQILIDALKDKQTNDSNFVLTHGYLAVIVDKIF